jgi:mannan endo-1,4-beta-mannosidase
MCMNRAAKAARALLLTALLPACLAAAYPHVPGRARPAATVTAGAVGLAALSAPATSTGTGFVLGAVTTDLVAFDRAVHKQAVLRMMFLRWDTPAFPGSTLTWNARHGAQTVIELRPAHLSIVQIGNGDGDTWLRQVFAAGIESFGKPVTISFAPEMNGQWYSWGHGRTKPADYVRAWRHVHDLLFGTKAGPLITWLWQPSAIHFSTPSPRPWWPGSKYVSEVGLDGYYVSPIDTFQIIFGQTIKLVRSLTSRPILVGETAVGATTGHAAADIANLFAGVHRYHLRGLVWFNIKQDAGKYHQDWRLQDHPRILRQFVLQLARVRVTP